MIFDKCLEGIRKIVRDKNNFSSWDPLFKKNVEDEMYGDYKNIFENEAKVFWLDEMTLDSLLNYPVETEKIRRGEYSNSMKTAEFNDSAVFLCPVVFPGAGVRLMGSG